MLSLLSSIAADERRAWHSALAPRELRSQTFTGGSLANPADWLLEAFGAMRTQAGVYVSERTAFQVATFFTCVTFIASRISSCPHLVCERALNKQGRLVDRIAYEHPEFDLVSLQPNEEMTARTFLLAFCIHMLAWPAAYAEIQRDASAAPAAHWPRDPNQTRPFRATAPLILEPQPWRPFPWTIQAGELAYETTDGQGCSDGAPDNARRVIRKEDMLCVPGMTFDGRLGISVVNLGRELLAHYLATQNFGARYFANYARPGGILNIPTNTGNKDEAKKSWQEAHSGSNINGTAVLPAGWTFTPYTDDPTKAQSIETLKFLRSQICALFHLAPRFAGDTSVTARANAEQEALEVIDTCNPWMEAMAQEWKVKLFPKFRGVRSPFFTKFDTWAMRHPDAATREKFYKTMRSLGAINANDMREREGMNPIEADWAEDYWMPTNMTLTTTPVDPTRQRLLVAAATQE